MSTPGAGLISQHQRPGGEAASFEAVASGQPKRAWHAAAARPELSERQSRTLTRRVGMGTRNQVSRFCRKKTSNGRVVRIALVKLRDGICKAKAGDAIHIHRLLQNYLIWATDPLLNQLTLDSISALQLEIQDDPKVGAQPGSSRLVHKGCTGQLKVGGDSRPDVLIGLPTNGGPSSWQRVTDLRSRSQA